MLTLKTLSYTRSLFRNFKEKKTVQRQYKETVEKNKYNKHVLIHESSNYIF